MPDQFLDIFSPAAPPTDTTTPGLSSDLPTSEFLATDSPIPTPPVAGGRKRKLWEWAWDVAMTTGIIRAAFAGKKTLVKLVVALVAAIAGAIGIAFGIAGAWLFLGKGDKGAEKGGPDDGLDGKQWWWSIIRDFPYKDYGGAIRAPISVTKINTMLANPKTMLKQAMPYVNMSLIPLIGALRKPFLLTTAYFESYGLPTAVGAAGERGMWQVNRKRFDKWRTATGVSVVDFERSPRLQAELLNVYLKEDFLPNWNASKTKMSSGLKLLDRLTPKLPSELRIAKASVLWMNGPDPLNRFTNLVRLAGGLTRALSVMMVLLRKRDIKDVAMAMPRTDAVLTSAVDFEKAMPDRERVA